jgi:CHRD domain-containing protein
MKRLGLIGLAVLAVVFIGSDAVRAHDDGTVVLRASLRGAEEVPPISSTATAKFTATIHPDGNIDFSLSFQGLAANAVASHIHFGQRGVSGGVMIFLCGGGGQPACPAATSGLVEGSIVAANVTGPTAQGIAATELAKALRAIGQGEGYVNIHNAIFTAGEIRGQIKVRGDLDED